MTAREPEQVLRGAIVGLGMMGRHHARLLQTTPRIAFAGAVDPLGDRHGAVRDADRVHATIDELIDRGRPDFAIVAVPTEEHLGAVRALASAGVHVLIEKPLAGSVEEAREVIAICRDAGIRAAVGHVERFNPALVELRRRTEDGQVGEVFLIGTERCGPFPDRVKDVGVVKDLATHDLDLVGWLGKSPIDLVAAQTVHKTGRAHEDLVLASGRLRSGLAFSITVDWLTPLKIRRMRILGDRGMLVADTLTSDLVFHENGRVTSEWDSTQALRGVAEGNSTRYALRRREPLLAELEAFCAFVRGDDASGAVSLEEGLQAVRCAEKVLESARRSETVRL
ncbi:MAG TPA: Gfo/Idh/MocA family oxidoreductase [Solirubrobacteraceae bacterium]|nr:Gfo/Idh/MocA family oxidoreductase [Solirubrobacteraceae bacterium]